MKIRLAGITWHTKKAGPWVTSEIFTQGCPRSCPSCFNPQTQDLDGGHILPISYLAEQLIDFVEYKRLTISGGEPLLQYKELTELIKLLKENSSKWKILCYTGYTWEEIYDKIESGDEALLTFLKYIDILVDGPFIEDLAQPIGDCQFVGSSNQRIIDVARSLSNNTLKLWR